jgi:phosphodiesterase/alkaline phosphatase D-like protein
MTLDRRDFLRTAGTTAGLMLTSRELESAQAQAEKGTLYRLASCSSPIRSIFKSRGA